MCRKPFCTHCFNLRCARFRTKFSLYGHNIATPLLDNFESLRGIVNQQKSKPKKVVLAYSGGLDTSIIIPWLKENYGCEVIAVIGDVGQQEDLEAARKKALATGASSAHVEDLREEFVRDYIWPTLRAGAVYEHTYLLGTSMARPVIAKRQAEVALQVGADGLSHGCTGKGNDQVRFELAYKAIAPNLQIIAPWREWDINSREDAIAYAQKHNVPVEQSKKNIYSRDRNIWHLSHEGGELEDPANAPNEAMWQWVVSPEKAPDKAEEVEIGFEAGTPVSVNGSTLGPVDLLNTLNDIKRVSPFSLYRADLASFTMGRYNPKDAEGFINLFALPVTVRPKAKAEGNK